MIKKIDTFRGAYSFLSNFSTQCEPFYVNGIEYKTVEHFYHAMKFRAEHLRVALAQHPLKGIKRYARNLKGIREDWDQVRVVFMKYALRMKFYDTLLEQKLIATELHYLEEGNWWNDKFWGVYEGEGLNMLGKLLMEVREEIMLGKKVAVKFNQIEKRYRKYINDSKPR